MTPVTARAGPRRITDQDADDLGRSAQSAQVESGAHQNGSMQLYRWRKVPRAIDLYARLVSTGQTGARRRWGTCPFAQKASHWVRVFENQALKSWQPIGVKKLKALQRRDGQTLHLMALNQFGYKA